MNRLAKPQPQCTLNPSTTSQMMAINDNNDIVPAIRNTAMRFMSIEVLPNVIMASCNLTIELSHSRWRRARACNHSVVTPTTVRLPGAAAVGSSDLVRLPLHTVTSFWSEIFVLL